jgi:hypothetical protein
MSDTPSHSPIPTTEPDYGLYVGLLFGFVSVFFFALQSNGVEVNWLWSGAIYIGCTGGVVWTTLKHALPGQSRAKRYSMAALLVVVCTGLGIIGTTKQYHKDHPPYAAPIITPPRQAAFRGEILAVNIGDVQGNPCVLVWFSVYNSGPPSIVTHYTVSFKDHEGSPLVGSSLQLPKSIRFIESGARISAVDKASLIEKTLQEPIQTGASVRGLLGFQFPAGSRPRIVRHFRSMVISFQDASGNWYTADGTFTDFLAVPPNIVGEPPVTNDRPKHRRVDTH